MPSHWPSLITVVAVVNFASGAEAGEPGELKPVPLSARITKVQPMTGIVLWTTNARNRTDAIQLEYSYMRYGDVASKPGEYDWSAVDRVLAEVAGRGHQAILRFHDTYPGRETTVPAFLKAMPDYRETRGKSEGRETAFPDWSHPGWKQFVLDFHAEFARRFDTDPRLAFVETGFGLWAEYHIYDGPMELGRTFPDKAFQTEFVQRLARVFRQTPWMISIDAADGDRTPFASSKDLLGLRFGLFDDSFLLKGHAGYNAESWAFFGKDRWKVAPAGGEFNYASKKDQTEALAPNGPHGESFEKAARRFHISFMIGDAQPRHQSWERVKEAGMACGYRFRILAFESGTGRSRITIANEGIAPLYHDAFPAVDGARSDGTLKGLLPGDRKTFEVAKGGNNPILTIESDRLAPGQRIDFNADLD